MQIGIVGLPFAGKSTLYQAITRTHIDPAGLAKAEAHHSVVKVPDPRLQALELKPGHVGALTTRGSIFAELGKWSEARRDFEQALKIDRRDDGALYGLSQALREAKEYGAAQSALSELISRSGNFVYWLEWVRIVMIRYWRALLLVAIGWALKSKFMKARTEANG